MRLLICAGGTGGGVYPALTVLQALNTSIENDHDLTSLWVGSQGGIEQELVKRANVPFQTIPAAGVHGVALKNLPRNIWHLLKGLAASFRTLKDFKPDVLLFTGGYVAVPMAVAASVANLFRRKLKYRAVLFIPDIEPGLALKVLARFATRIAVVNEETFQYLPKSIRKRLVITGYPSRLEKETITPPAARQVFGLSEELPVLLFVGGSTGARSINHALLSSLPKLLDRFQVIHLSGSRDWELVEAANKRIHGDRTVQLPEEFQDIEPHSQSQRYHAFAYLHEEMAAALSSADLVISRAGASCLGEYPLFSLPAILVPYPYAWRYQKINADYLVNHHAAILLKDNQLRTRLLPLIEELFQQPDTLQKMKANMGDLRTPQAASKIADIIFHLASLNLPVERSQKRREETTQ